MSADRQQRQASSKAVPLHIPAASRGASSRLLGDFLRQQRRKQGMSLEEAGELIRSSSSKISRLERGESPAKERDVWDLVVAYGLPEAEYDDVHDLLRQVRHETKGRRYSDVTPGFLQRLVNLESCADRILTYENHVVPGLLQTARYARVLVKAAMPDADTVTIDRFVRARMERAELFEDPQRPEVVAILDEGVLRRVVGGRDVMHEQLEHLRRAADEETSHVAIRIIPFDGTGVSYAPSFPLTHLRIPDGGPSEIVYIEQMESAEYVTERSKVARHRTVLTELMGCSLPLPQSITFLDDMIRKYAALDAD